MARRSQSKGITLVEMMVVISIITILAAIALPALSSARESARNSSCQSNLHQLGVGIASRAARQQSFCSGAFDWRRDGDVTRFGWVADLVAQGHLVGQMLCPSSTCRLGETYHDLLNASFTPAEQQCNPRLVGKDLMIDGTLVPSPSKELLSLPAGSEQRRLVVENRIWGKGYNTNYVASWLLVRSAVRLGPDGNLRAVQGCTVDMKSVGCTAGPSTPARVDAHSSSSLIPFLACGAGTGQILEQALGDVAAGFELAESFTDGPVETATMKPPSVSAGTPAGGPQGWARRWRETRQDYRDFGPVHGRRNGSCNVLFADGGVRIFVDQNADRLFNNGFPASAATGFTDDTVELPEMEVYSSWQ